MARPLKFVRLETSIKGLLTRAETEWNRYLGKDISPSDFHWVFIEDPEILARTLEVLSVDLPEEDLAGVVTRMPYLLLLFVKEGRPADVPVESTLAFLSVLNQRGLVTILRQSTDRELLAPFFKLDPQQWRPVFFLVGGKADLDAGYSTEPLENTSFY